MNGPRSAMLVAAMSCFVGACAGRGAAPSAGTAAAPCALPVGTVAQASVHLDTLRPGEPMSPTLPEGWRVSREEAVDDVRAVVLTWPGNALGVVIVRDTPQRCVLGAWVLAFGGLGVELTGWRMERDARDGAAHVTMTYVATYNNPPGEDGATEHGLTELRSDGRTAELVRTEGYANFE